MNEELRGISGHMLSLGLGALAHANWHANYYSTENAQWPELSVLQAAHAAEILIKARIAEEHPLLIFDQLPKFDRASPTELQLKNLFEKGRTVQYAELPDRLWAVTGLTLDNLQQYQDFGRLRNAIQHFAPPTGEGYGISGLKASEYIYGVIDSFINKCWGLYAIDFNEDYEPYEYLVPTLVEDGIIFNVSPELVKDMGELPLVWKAQSPAYKAEMDRRLEEAKHLI